MFKTIISLIAVFVFALMATPAHAGLLAINGDFDTQVANGSPPPDYVAENNYTGTAAAPDTGTFWNPFIFISFTNPAVYHSIYFSNTNPIPLQTSAGGSSPVTFQADNNSNIINGGGNYAGEPATLLTEDYMYSAGTSNFSFNNVPSSLYGYALYLYAATPNQLSATAFTITTGGSGTLIADQTTPYNTSPTTWIAGTNYVEFTGLNPVGGVIAGSYTAADIVGYPFYTGPGDTNGSPWNGFQLVELPEPASMSLLAVGGLLMLMRRRA